MQPLTNVDEMLEQWEQIKKLSCPRGDGFYDVIVHECAKNDVEAYAQQIRKSRLVNDIKVEEEACIKFEELYLEFTKNFVFRVLKNG